MPSRPGRRYSGVVLASHMRSELDRLIQEVLAAAETAAGRGTGGGWVPAVDVLDIGHALLVQVEVAGLAAKDVKVELEGTTVRISGRRKLAFPRGGRIRFHCLERQEGEFVRQLDIFEPVNVGAAHARLEHGLLCIELPKVEERRRRLVTLEIADTEEGKDG